MKWELFLIVLILMVVTIFGLPSRIKRQQQQQQGFSMVNPDTVTTQATTTTTASPQYTSCIRACRTTTQYNPVCGSNRVTYNNEAQLKCAVRCGLNVELVFIGACTPAT